ncbi:MAG: M24 family metallopeptidase [Alphaproteobacteria bacterium]|nr:M24 family metallopeptidase [Alphaproteobacteria bacterium]
MMNVSQDCSALLFIVASPYPGVAYEGADFLKRISGLKASAGAVVISENKSAVFVDGRYELAAKLLIDPNKFSIEKLSFENIARWIENNLEKETEIAIDYRFFSISSLNKIKSRLRYYKFTSCDFDKLFSVPKQTRNAKILEWNIDKNRFDCILNLINKHNLDGYLICDPCSSAYLLNLRDLNTKNTPVVLGYTLITKGGEHILYVDNSYNLPYKNIKQLQNDLTKFQKIGTDFNEAPAFLNSSNFVNIENPIINEKCVKSSAEIQNIQEIAKQDSQAIVNFMYWFYHHDDISEIDCVNKLFALRRENKDFVSNSFDTIAAADEHSAIVHYSPTNETNAIIQKFLLLDSGGQYLYGTTDITRTFTKIIPTKEEKTYYTLVLKGHISVANAKLPKDYTGAALDVLARQYLWNAGLDYNHGTGHGIGYMLNVHEGPIAISKKNSVPLKANMLLSNEPGIYFENHLGIRLENMIVVKNLSENFFAFDTISLVPFDFNFIDVSLLTCEEKKWLIKYHRDILDKLQLRAEVKSWLTSDIISPFLSLL